MLKVALLILQVFILRAQEEVVLEGPEPPVPAVNVNVTYTCRANGSIVWAINEIQVMEQSFVEELAPSGIFVPLEQEKISVARINAQRINNTRLQCQLIGSILEGVLGMSSVINFTTFGTPNPPLDLEADISQGGYILSWTPGLTSLNENVTFVVNVTNSSMFEVSSGITSPSFFASTLSSGRTCEEYVFTVYAQNAVGISDGSLQAQRVAPTDLATLAAEAFVSLANDMASFNVSFKDPSPCPEFAVLHYNVTLTELANSFNDSLSSPIHIFPAVYVKDGAGMVIVIVNSSSGVLLNRQYMLELTATSNVSSSQTNLTIYTTGLQEASVILNSTLSSITVTCIFAEGSTALGCQALLIDGMTLVMVNVSSGDTVAMTTVLLPLGAQLNDVLIAEVLQNGEVSAIRRTIETSATTQQQSTLSTVQTTEEILMVSSTEQLSDTTSNNTGLSIGGSTLYVVIGVIVGVILVLVFIIMVVLVIIRSNHKEKTSRVIMFNSGEELRTNYLYGGRDSSPHICGTDEFAKSGKHARCNTYDTADPHVGGASNGKSSAPIPTYATVETARMETLLAGGPAVLNPVYGPSGSSLSPATSPTPTPVSISKQAPNPIYSEACVSKTGKSVSKEEMKQMPIVSGLNPVYGGLGSVTSSLQSQGDLSPRYPNNPEVPKSPGNALFSAPSSAANGSSPPYPPLYEELKPVKLQPVPVQGKDPLPSLTSNESYGILNAEQVNEIKSPP